MPLPVHHVVVLEEVLADFEVLSLDLALRAGDRGCHALVLDGHVVRHLECLQNPVHDVGLEQPHQVITEREVEPALSGITLPAGTAAKLVVDAARLVTFRSDDVKPTKINDFVVTSLSFLLELSEELWVSLLVLLRALQRVDTGVVQFLVSEEFGVSTQDDVGAAAGHVGGYRDRTLGARHGDDGGFPLMLLGVEHLMPDSGTL